MRPPPWDHGCQHPPLPHASDPRALSCSMHIHVSAPSSVATLWIPVLQPQDLQHLSMDLHLRHWSHHCWVLSIVLDPRGTVLCKYMDSSPPFHGCSMCPMSLGTEPLSLLASRCPGSWSFSCCMEHPHSRYQACPCSMGTRSCIRQQGHNHYTGTCESKLAPPSAERALTGEG